MFPISEPLSNHFLLSLIPLVPGLLALRYLPWNRISDVTITMNSNALTLKRENLVTSAKMILAIFTVVMSFSLFSPGLSQGQGWLRFVYLGVALLSVGLHLKKAVD
ncbi:hypothetical protein AB6M97_03305 [Streptococcus hillyeri]|uniref:Uncharacterized protein n=1 Tax=Streptococcus hillyeri TaxID=2282420 RepID=A0A3L9DS36_9STRE|nr:hypothetical protein [Streptococcus hillyeri]RLY02399.1 hypothetical protein EAF07_07465 [Streptococcus hillyeri]